jgi:hypothetical protein
MEKLKSWIVVAGRLLSLVFAVVVFATIANADSDVSTTQFSSNETCVYGGEDSTCRLAIGVGVFSFSLVTILAFFDVLIYIATRKWTEKWKKPFSLLDMLFSFTLAIVWFALFIILVKAWSSSLQTSEHNGALAAIVFSFFFIASMVICLAC